MNRKGLKRGFEYVMIKLLIESGRCLPRSLGLKLFAGWGRLASSLFRHQRRLAVENMAVAFPQAPPLIREALARAMFITLGKNFYDFVRLKDSSPQQVRDLVEKVEGYRYFQEAFARGRGVISVTGHIGCWELMAAYFVAVGYPVSVVARRLWLGRLNRDLVATRRSLGVEVVDRDEGARSMLRVLKSGKVLGVLMDQNTKARGVWVPFFNRPAHTPVGVARLACLTGALVVPMAIYMTESGRHRIKVLPPLDPKKITGNREERIGKITRLCNQALEELIRLDPKQWVWFHPRWREGRGESFANKAVS